MNVTTQIVVYNPPWIRIKTKPDKWLCKQLAIDNWSPYWRSLSWWLWILYLESLLGFARESSVCRPVTAVLQCLPFLSFPCSWQPIAGNLWACDIIRSRQARCGLSTADSQRELAEAQWCKVMIALPIVFYPSRYMNWHQLHCTKIYLVKNCSGAKYRKVPSNLYCSLDLLKLRSSLPLNLRRIFSKTA